MIRTNVSRLAIAAASAIFVAAASVSVAAQPAAQAPANATPTAWKAANLKILPADMPREQVIAVMKNFTTALGVECAFCHTNGANGKLDPASDAKKEKAAARWMMTMVRDLNTKFEVKDMSQPKVTCYTCHRGNAHPATKPGEQPAAHKH